MSKWTDFSRIIFFDYDNQVTLCSNLIENRLRHCNFRTYTQIITKTRWIWESHHIRNNRKEKHNDERNDPHSFALYVYRIQTHHSYLSIEIASAFALFLLSDGDEDEDVHWPMRLFCVKTIFTPHSYWTVVYAGQYWKKTYHLLETGDRKKHYQG